MNMYPTEDRVVTTESSPEGTAAVPRSASDFGLGAAIGAQALGAWFLGPKAENRVEFTNLVKAAIDSHCDDRELFYPDDPKYVTDDIKESGPYKDSLALLCSWHKELLGRLQGSVPFFSYRYQAHMNWDQTLPALVGYFAGMLYNQNNVAREASLVTTTLEKEVANDLCEMLGYGTTSGDGADRPWGHVTCDGTVANIEALWSARNLKYYPIAVAHAIRAEEKLAPARGVTVIRPDGTEARLLDLELWGLLNLPVGSVLGLPYRIKQFFSSSVPDGVLDLINAYTVQDLGYEEFRRRFLPGEIGPPAVLVVATMHYSWPKAAALVGIGKGNVISVQVDLDAHADLTSLRERLEDCRKNKRPVIANVAVIGSTEQNCVDPLAGILNLRKEFAKGNFTYPIHADAAWGGYFRAMLPSSRLYGQARRDAPVFPMSEYVIEQYERLPEVDSITVDSHKAGFVPYPAGALCYRDGRQRRLVSVTAPYIDSGTDSGLGFFGVEGSKPGAAAAGVWLSHKVIPTDQNGYGRILGQAMFNSKLLYAAIVTIGRDPKNEDILVVPTQRLPAERKYPREPEKWKKQLQDIHDHLVDKSNEEIIKDPEAMKLLAGYVDGDRFDDRGLGSDQVIIGYVFNKKKTDGNFYSKLSEVNKLNQAIADLLTMTLETAAANDMPSPDKRPPMFVQSSEFTESLYGKDYVDRLTTQLGVKIDINPVKVKYLISCTMDPWVTDTEAGSFIPTLSQALADAVHKATIN